MSNAEREERIIRLLSMLESRLAGIESTMSAEKRMALHTQERQRDFLFVLGELVWDEEEPPK